VLADRSCRLSPDGWARRAVQAYDDYAADLVLGEVNNGGDLVEQTIRTVRRSIPYRKVHASRGKAVRAQPVAALYEQGKVSHAEVFAELEEQLTSWTPESGTSPDRLDALVWALTELMVREQRAAYVY
jgi:phage terminase large subunit-like protein